MKTAIILISEAGLNVAELLHNELSESEIFTSQQQDGCTHIDSAGSFVAEHFHHYDALILSEPWESVYVPSHLA